jgi:OmpA-OmpF porin, OOP family
LTEKTVWKTTRYIARFVFSRWIISASADQDGVSQPRVPSFGEMSAAPDHDAVIAEVKQYTEQLGDAGSLDEGTFMVLDELIGAWVEGWTRQVETDYFDYQVTIAAHRNRMTERLAKAEQLANHEHEELDRIRVSYLASRARLSGHPASPAASADNVAAAQASAARRGWAEPQLLAGRGTLALLVLPVLILVGAMTDTVAFRITLEVVLQHFSATVAWFIAAGATAMSLVIAYRFGIALAIHRRGGSRSPITLSGTSAAWLALGLAMFLIRWLDGGSATQSYDGVAIPATPLVAFFFLAIYLISGACTIFEAERLHNPEYTAYRKLRGQHDRQAAKAAEADAALERARSAVAEADDKLRNADQARDAEMGKRRALGNEAKQHTRVLMSILLRDPARTYVPDQDPSSPGGQPVSPLPARRATMSFTSHHARLVALTAAVAAFTALIVGCSQPAGQKQQPPPAMPDGCTKTGPVVFAVSGRADSPAPGLTTAMVTAATAAIGDGSAIGIVDVDGSPALIKANAFNPSGLNSVALASDEDSYLRGVETAVEAIRATHPHADVLDALEVAGRAIRAACPYGGTIYLEDSGLQETGWVNFRQGLLSAQPSDVVRFLAAQHELPQLSGINVIFSGLGDTAPPQAPLSISQRSSVIAIWTSIAKAAGAASVTIDPSPRIGIAAPRDVPQVLLVPVPAPQGWSSSDHRYVFPDNGPVGFLPNVAVFRDPAAAQAALRSLATYLIANPSARILLTGTTARVPPLTGCIALSLKRAKAVRQVLVGDGADYRQIYVAGVGWEFPGYENDQGPDGTLIPGTAEHNRSVIVTLTTSSVLPPR